MGNCQACLSQSPVHNSNEEDEQEAGGGGGGEGMVRVVRTTDNELFEFPGPVSVKDLLFGFQGFAVFLNKPPPSSSLKKKQAAQPLHPDTLLQLRHLYYLNPLVNPSLINNAPLQHHETKPSLLAKQASEWVKPALIKPFINVGAYSLINGSGKDLLLGQQVALSSAKPSINEAAEDPATRDKASDWLASCTQEKLLAEDLNAQEKALIELAECPLFNINAEEGSPKEHAEALVDAQSTRALSHASLALNANDRALNEPSEGLLTAKAQEKPSCLDVPMDQSPSQTMKVKKVRFSNEVEVIPSSSDFVHSGRRSPPPPACSTPRIASSTTASSEELMHRFGAGIRQVGEQLEYCGATKEEVIPHMNKKEMKGMVRLKVVISKKQLTELMAARASGEKQSDALMEKMLAPLLSPTSSCHKGAEDSFLLQGGSCGSPSNWRPSLHHIPEDHSFQELY